jgi:uncharacterized protein with FMN-binding domain
MPWKEQPTTGAIKGHVTTRDGQRFDTAVITLSPLSAKGEVRTLRTDGNGWFGAIELAPGTYKVTVQLDGYNGQFQRTVNIKAGTVSTIDFDKLREHQRGKPSAARAHPYVASTTEQQAQIEAIVEP